MSYRIAIGEVDPSITGTVVPQPRSPGINEGIRTEGGNGISFIDGWPSTVWEFSYLTAEQYDSLLNQFGLATVPSRQVTIYTTIDEDRTFASFYAIIHRPLSTNEKQYNVGWRTVQFSLTRLRLT